MTIDSTSPRKANTSTVSHKFVHSHLIITIFIRTCMSSSFLAGWIKSTANYSTVRKFILVLPSHLQLFLSSNLLLLPPNLVLNVCFITYLNHVMPIQLINQFKSNDPLHNNVSFSWLPFNWQQFVCHSITKSLKIFHRIS